MTNNKANLGGRKKARRKERELVEMVERLQRDVSESSAKTDWHSAVEDALEKEIQSLRVDLTHIAERGSEQWHEEARGWFEVQREMLGTKLEELSKASEARLDGHVRQLHATVEERANDVRDQARLTAAKVARTASEERLLRAEQQLEARFEHARAELDRRLFETMVHRMAEIERNAKRHAESEVEALGERLVAMAREAGARLAAQTEHGLDGMAQAEGDARERLLGLGEELATEIVLAEQAQQHEREVHSEARKVAAGLEELRKVSRRSARRAI